jgi:hypothetical protein
VRSCMDTAMVDVRWWAEAVVEDKEKRFVPREPSAADVRQGEA